MLEIEIPKREFFDSEHNRFIYYESLSLKLEHSLYSLSKWESKWKKPFLSDRPQDKKTVDEVFDYIACMCLNEKLDKEIISTFPASVIEVINEYINDSMTATKIYNAENDANISKSVDTAEVIYYYMVELGIPFECEHWPLQKLMTLIQVCGVKRSESSNKKMSKREIMNRNRKLNEARKAKFNTKG